MKNLFLICLFAFSYNYSTDNSFAEQLKDNRNLLLENHQQQKRLANEIQHKEKIKIALENNLRINANNYLDTIKQVHADDKILKKNYLQEESIKYINKSSQIIKAIKKKLIINQEDQKQKKYSLETLLYQENQLLQNRAEIAKEKNAVEVIGNFFKASVQKLQTKRSEESMQMQEEEQFEKNRLAQIVQDQKKEAKILSEKAVAAWKTKKEEQEKKRWKLKKEENEKQKKLKDLEYQQRLQTIKENQEVFQMQQEESFEKSRLKEQEKQNQINANEQKRAAKKVAKQEEDELVKIKYTEKLKSAEESKKVKEQLETDFADAILKVVESRPFDVFRCNYKKNGCKNILSAITTEHDLKKLVESIDEVIKEPTKNNYEKFLAVYHNINKKSQELDHKISWDLFLNPELDKNLSNIYRLLKDQKIEDEKKILNQELVKYENMITILDQEKLIYQALVDESLQALKENKDVEKNKSLYKRQLLDLTKKTKRITDEMKKIQNIVEKLEKVNILSDLFARVKFHKEVGGILATSHLQDNPNINRYQNLKERIKDKDFDIRSSIFKEALVKMKKNQFLKHQQSLLVNSVINLPGDRIELLTKERLKQVMQNHDLFVLDEVIEKAFSSAKMYSRGGVFFVKDNFIYEFDRDIKHLFVEKSIPCTQEQVDAVVYETVDILETFVEVIPMKNS
ncbi:MAG: hypothetical protein ACXWL5_01305 [Candidatus Chromulinivorax sp.]